MYNICIICINICIKIKRANKREFSLTGSKFYFLFSKAMRIKFLYENSP